MSQTKKVAATVQQLYRHYIISISLLGLLLLLLLFRLLPFLEESQPINFTFERYLIMVTLIAIPLTLKWFANRLQNCHRPLLWEDARRRYRQAYLWRHYILSVVTLLHILLFGISHNTNFFWFSVVLFIVFLYCRPSLPELEILLEEPVKRDGALQENQDNKNDDTPTGE